MNITAAKDFIIHNASPLELALYRFFYEKKEKEAVIAELEKYQNEDGGFGNGLEADNWNPHSNPIATNDVIITLYRIGAFEKDSAMVKDIIRYLSFHDSFNEEKKRWLFATDSNADCPHAIWWKKDRDGINFLIQLLDFFCGMNEMFMTKELYPLAAAEKAIWGKIQKEDGGFDISWQWYTDYKEFETARDWWRPRLTLDKLMFYEA